MIINKDPVFDIYDRVYHNTPESPVAVVLDIRYHVSDNDFEYLVSTGFGDYYWCTANELTTEKQVI